MYSCPEIIEMIGYCSIGLSIVVGMIANGENIRRFDSENPMPRQKAIYLMIFVNYIEISMRMGCA